MSNAGGKCILLDIFVGMAQMYPGTPFRADITGAKCRNGVPDYKNVQ
jgi:hypothetical protein